MNTVQTENKMTMTVLDAATLLGISQHTAYLLASEGKLPGAFWLNGRILVSGRVLKRFVDGEHHGDN